jgi:hypothetical protein
MKTKLSLHANSCAVAEEPMTASTNAQCASARQDVDRAPLLEGQHF